MLMWRSSSASSNVLYFCWRYELIWSLHAFPVKRKYTSGSVAVQMNIRANQVIIICSIYSYHKPINCLKACTDSLKDLYHITNIESNTFLFTTDIFLRNLIPKIYLKDHAMEFAAVHVISRIITPSKIICLYQGFR